MGTAANYLQINPKGFPVAAVIVSNSNAIGANKMTKLQIKNELARIEANRAIVKAMHTADTSDFPQIKRTYTYKKNGKL